MRALEARSLRDRFPLVAGLELTFRCNLACVHCYVNQPANDRGEKARELTTDEWKRVLDEVADAGVLWLTFTGGEPLLRPDFCELYEYAHAKGFVLAVYTNATLITEKHVELWRKKPPRMLEITQYGFTPEVYDDVVDAGPQYDRFRRGLDRVHAAGIPVTLKAIAMRRSAHELHQIGDWARANGMSFRFDTVITPRIDGGMKPLAERLTPAEIAALETNDAERNDQFADYCASFVGTPPPSDAKYTCGAGTNTIIVDPYGKMHVCQLSRKPGWDVLRDGLMRGYVEGFGALRAEKRADTTGCASCAGANVCSNCVGMAELEQRSVEVGDPYFCNMTDARLARVMGDARPIPNGLVKLRLRGEHGRQP
jgi:radical SAM protein with 4Fe4S-binding SPASM domain